MPVHKPRFVFVALCVSLLLLVAWIFASHVRADSNTSMNQQQDSDQLVWDANTVQLESRELQPGVYAVVFQNSADALCRLTIVGIE